MPITGPTSYPPTINTFLEHWEEVDDALGPLGPLVTAGGIARADLDTLGESLNFAREGVTDAGVNRTLARGSLNEQLVAIQARMVEFNTRVRADLPGSIYAGALPNAFAVGDAEGPVRDGLRQMAKLWEKVSAISPVPPGMTLPLQLQGAFTLTLFDTARLALRAAYRALSDRDVELRLARGQRNKLQDQIYDILKNYRMKVPASLPAGSPLLDTLPALSPPQGRTPAAIEAQAAWDAASSKAKITWDASEDDDLASYQVRGEPGDNYSSEDESVIATVLPADAREVLTDFALGSPGLTTGFKVYVVLNTGHEKGSEAVYVTRPT